MSLVEKAESSFAISSASIGRIKKNTAAHQDTEGFRDQRTDPPHVEIRAAIAVGASKTLVDVSTHGPVPVPLIGGVDREFRRIGRDPNALRCQQELLGTPVENEDVDTGIQREHERGLRTVNNEAGGTLRGAGLEERRQNVVAPGPDRKYGSDRNVVFQVSRSVERIDRNTERRVGIEGFGKRHFLGKNRGDRCMP